MEEKLITIVVLPYSKAHILKMKLEAKEIECDLEQINLIEGAASSTVRVKILEKDLTSAISVLDSFLGKKTIIEPIQDVKERHILVPVDFSVNAEKACKMAFNIASHLQVKVVFMHSYINPIIHSVPFSDIYTYDSSLLLNQDEAEKKVNKDFQEFITKVAGEIGKERWETVATEFIIKSGYPDEDILDYAHENRSQLIVLGSSGQSASKNAIGSIAADVMYNAKVPVLLIPENAPVKELKEFSKVLYATNFDEKDFQALDKLMAILYPFDIKTVCLHVGETNGNDWDLARLNGMKDILKEKYRTEDFDCRLITGNNPLDALEQFIKDEEIDILSLTTHKRNMISRLFNPSLARKMAFHGTTPLLIFHA